MGRSQENDSLVFFHESNSVTAIFNLIWKSPIRVKGHIDKKYLAFLQSIKSILQLINLNKHSGFIYDLKTWEKKIVLPQFETFRA